MHDREDASLHEQRSIFCFLDKKTEDDLCEIVDVLNFQDAGIKNKCYQVLK